MMANGTDPYTEYRNNGTGLSAAGGQASGPTPEPDSPLVPPGLQAAAKLGFYRRQMWDPNVYNPKTKEMGMQVETRGTDEEARRALEAFARNTNIPLASLLATEQGPNTGGAIQDLLSQRFGPPGAMASQGSPGTFISTGAVPQTMTSGEMRDVPTRITGYAGGADFARNMREGIMAAQALQASQEQQAQFVPFLAAALKQQYPGMTDEQALEMGINQAKASVYAPGSFSGPQQAPSMGMGNMDLSGLLSQLLGQSAPSMAPLSVRYA